MEEVRERKRKEKERQQEQDMIHLGVSYQEVELKVKMHRTSTIEAVLVRENIDFLCEAPNTFSPL